MKGFVAQPPLGQGFGEGVPEPAGGIGHIFRQFLRDDAGLGGRPGDAQPGGQQIRVLEADAAQVLGGGAATPLQGHAAGGLGVLQIGMEGVALVQVADGEVGVGRALADGERDPAAPVRLGQELEQEGAGDLAHGWLRVSAVSAGQGAPERHLGPGPREVRV